MPGNVHGSADKDKTALLPRSSTLRGATNRQANTETQVQRRDREAGADRSHVLERGVFEMAANWRKHGYIGGRRPPTWTCLAFMRKDNAQGS